MNWDNIGYYIVYKHTLPTGECYIGVTCKHPNRRWRNGEGYNRQPLFYSKILKYGWDNITHEIVATFPNRHDAWTYEHNLIQSNKDNCLNIKGTSTTREAKIQRKKYVKKYGGY